MSGDRFARVAPCATAGDQRDQQHDANDELHIIVAVQVVLLRHHRHVGSGRGVVDDALVHGTPLDRQKK